MVILMCIIIQVATIYSIFKMFCMLEKMNTSQEKFFMDLCRIIDKNFEREAEFLEKINKE